MPAYVPVRRRLYSRTAFTLVELTAVIAIVLLFLAISIPVTRGVLENARSAQCQSNLRQLGLAVQVYAIEHKGAIVPSRTDWGDNTYWPYLLAPNLGLAPRGTTPRGSELNTVFMCPEEKADATGKTQHEIGIYGMRYTINSHIAEVPNLLNNPMVSRSERMERMAVPKTMIFMDSFAGGLGFASTLASTYPHKNKAQVVYLDAHVEAKTPEQIAHYTSIPFHVFWRGYDWGYGGYRED